MTEVTGTQFLAARNGEEATVARLMTGVSLMALAFLLGIGAKAWYADHQTHAYALWLFAGLVSVNLALYAWRRDHVLQRLGMLLVVGLLFAYLIASGGESNTGPLWFYVFPPLLFYLTDLKTGTALLLLCLLFAVIVFSFPALPFVSGEYSGDFKIRFFATIAFESIFCFVLEASRLKARNELMALAVSHDQAARTDELTGLSNRRDMQQRLGAEYSRYQRSGHHFSVALVDLDLFKRINDDYGHDAGDAVLVQFARRVRSLIRQTDVAARWGGEEFLLLLPDTSLLQALTLAERLRADIEHTEFCFDGHRLPVTISVGVCSVTQADSVNQLLRQADINLYNAKESGRNRLAPRVRSRTTDGDAPDAPGN